jgi:hypothetical protein
MEEIGYGTGAGLAALGFWIFVASTIVAGVWANNRKRESEHETLRRVIESGQPLDDKLADKLLNTTSGSKDLDRDLKVSALLTLFLAPGMIVLGWGLSTVTEELFPIMLGVSGILLSLSIGLFTSSLVVRRWFTDVTLDPGPG